MRRREGSLAEREWPSLSGAGDRTYVRRLALAFAGAVALHEIAAGFIHGQAPNESERAARAEPITVTLHTPAPTPTAPPTPGLTPAPIVTFSEHASLAQAAPRAAARVHRHLGGRAAPRMTLVTPPHSLHATPAAIALATADASGLQTGAPGIGAGAGTNGEGGASASGSGSDGEGNGAGAGVKPCGVVMLAPFDLQVHKDGSLVMRIRLAVTLSDGATVNDVLGWPFHYRRERDDPFSPAGEKAGAEPLLQLPPPGYDLEGRQNSATVFAVKHTDAQGYTDLEDCPQPQISPH